MNAINNAEMDAGLGISEDGFSARTKIIIFSKLIRITYFT
jgi:hypothetical protein